MTGEVQNDGQKYRISGTTASRPPEDHQDLRLRHHRLETTKLGGYGTGGCAELDGAARSAARPLPVSTWMWLGGWRVSY